jgi:hypothetical protein
MRKTPFLVSLLVWLDGLGDGSNICIHELVKPCQNVKGNIPIDIPASRHQAMTEERKLVLAGPYTGRTRNTGLTQHRAIHYGQDKIGDRLCLFLH